VDSEVINFGGDVRFRPTRLLEPYSEDQLLAFLREHSSQSFRVMGSRHAWNEGIKTDEVLIDLKHFDEVRILNESGERVVSVGGGCKISKLLYELNKHGLTIPAIGLITAQTVAGATATGTHGSGKPSLSHFIKRARIACFQNDQPVIREVTEGDELRASRCSMGCLGILVEVILPVVPQYFVEENTVACDSLEQAFAHEAEWPLQQLYLLPHGWSWYAQRRRVYGKERRSLTAGLYNLYWLLGLNVAFVILLKLLTAVRGSKSLLRFFFRRIAPRLLITGWRATDRSDRILTMKHELFRHIELELFVRKQDALKAMDYLVDVLSAADDAEHLLSTETNAILRTHNLEQSFCPLRGSYTHDSPICLRRLLPDDTLISMASGDDQWVSISLVTYTKKRGAFFSIAEFLAKSTFLAFDSRIHWGKWFPLGADFVEKQYARLPRFREICDEYDPVGRFRNEFVVRSLGFSNRTTNIETESDATSASPGAGTD